MSKTATIIISVLLTIVVAVGIFFTVVPAGVEIRNNWVHSIRKADDKTNYETKKKVEDTCRVMISSYEADKLKYEQYKDSDNEEKQSWAEQAKMRANNTAASYNNYVLQNNYIWKDNIPDDIYRELPFIQ